MADFGTQALGNQGVNAGIGILGANTQASAIRAQSAYDQANAGILARRLNMQAQDANVRGALDVANVGRRANQIEGTQRAGLAAQGIDPNTGSAMDAQVSTETMSELDKLTARNNAAREAYGFQSQAAEVQSGAAMQALGAKNMARQTLLQGYLSGAKDVTTGLYQYNQMNGLPSKKSQKSQSKGGGSSTSQASSGLPQLYTGPNNVA